MSSVPYYNSKITTSLGIVTDIVNRTLIFHRMFVSQLWRRRILKLNSNRSSMIGVHSCSNLEISKQEENCCSRVCSRLPHNLPMLCIVSIFYVKVKLNCKVWIYVTEKSTMLQCSEKNIENWNHIWVCESSDMIL